MGVLALQQLSLRQSAGIGIADSRRSNASPRPPNSERVRAVQIVDDGPVIVDAEPSRCHA
jgi:hypothetical protein